MAGIPDTRSKENTIGPPSNGSRAKLNGEEIDLEGFSRSPSSMHKPKLIGTILSGAERSSKASPHAAWTIARLAPMALIALCITLITEGSGLVLIMMAGAFAFMRQDDIAKYVGENWNYHWFTDKLFWNRLPPSHCLECGQSIFDRSIPGQYKAEFDLMHFLPVRSCANCGHDHTAPVAQ